MERKKIGSEKSISDKRAKLKIGTTDKKCPSVVYVEGGMYIVPQNEENDYKNAINNIRKVFNGIGESIAFKNSLSDNFILDFQVAGDRMKKGKASFLSFQYYFKQRKICSYDEITNILSGNVKEYLDEMCNSILANGFEYSKTKS